ncbi:MAG: hypothetical protein K2X87_27925 [Gemmataceae bacterium]|nr:hypothetical protein [Gemmataceae bacterium]
MPKLRDHLPRIRKVLAAAPDPTLAELRAELKVAVTLSTLWAAVRSLGLTFRKSQPDPEAVGRPATGRPPSWVAGEHAHVVLIDEAGPPPTRWSAGPGDRGGGRRPSTPGAGTGTRRAPPGRCRPPGRRPVRVRLGHRPGRVPRPGKVVASLRGPLERPRRRVAARDGGSNHRGPAVRAVLPRGGRPRLGRLPACRPDRYPAEAVWSRLKYGEPANAAPADLHRPGDRVAGCPIELECDPGLLRRVWEGSGLPLPTRVNKQPGQPADQ